MSLLINMEKLGYFETASQKVPKCHFNLLKIRRDVQFPIKYEVWEKQ